MSGIDVKMLLTQQLLMLEHNKPAPQIYSIYSRAQYRHMCKEHKDYYYSELYLQ